MLHLIVTACLAANGKNCHDIELATSKKATNENCMNITRIEAEKWQKAHPDMMVVGWHCKYDYKDAKKTTKPKSKSKSTD